MRKFIQFVFVAIVIILLFISHAFAGGSLLLKNARLIDGTGSPVQEGVSILIVDGRIVKIGKNLSKKGVPELDVQGSYILPGIIDAHVHLMRGPGAQLNNYDRPRDNEEWKTTWGENIKKYLRAYLACGVTTVLDAHAPAFVIKDIRDHLANGNPGPRFLTVGSFFSPPGGYVASEQNPPVSSRSEVEAKLDAMKSLGVIGIKVPIEKGMNPFWNMPRHPSDILSALKEGAAQRNLPTYVHASSEEDFNTALDLDVHALMHTIHYRMGKQLSTNFIERMSRTNAFQVSTLSIMDAELTRYNPDRLNEPLLEVVAPRSELLKARDPNAGPTAQKMFIAIQAPWLLKIFSGIFANIFFEEDHVTKSLLNAQKAIHDLHNAGVPIVMGSDTTYNGFTPYQFHGFTSLREIELLGEAGLLPAEAIKAATVNAAEMVGLNREIGTIKVGKCADLVILKDNPLINLRAFRTVQWTVKDGVVKTPKEWMAL